MLSDQQLEIATAAWTAARTGGAIAVDDELRADAEELVQKGWLRPAEGEHHTGYAWSETGETALAFAGMMAEGSCEN